VGLLRWRQQAPPHQGPCGSDDNSPIGSAAQPQQLEDFCSAQPHMLECDCPSVCPSVTSWYCLKTNNHIIMRFSPSGRLGLCFYVNFHILGARGIPLPMGFKRNCGDKNGEKKLRFLTDKSLCIGNDRR